MFVKSRFSDENREGHDDHEEHGRPLNDKEEKAEIDKFFPRSAAQRKQVPVVDEGMDLDLNKFLNRERRTWGMPYPTNPT